MSKDETTIRDREAFLEESKGNLDRLNEQIAQLEVRLSEIDAPERQQYKRKIDELKDLRETYTQRVEAFKTPTTGAREEVHAGLNDAWQNLTDALEKTKAHFGTIPKSTS